MKQPKPLLYSTAGIGNVLKRGGLDRSTSTTTRIRGYHSVSTGYKVKASNFVNGTFVVEWVGRLGTTAEERAKMFDRVGDILTEAGYKIARTSWSGDVMENGPYWTVYPPEPA